MLNIRKVILGLMLLSFLATASSAAELANGTQAGGQMIVKPVKHKKHKHPKKRRHKHHRHRRIIIKV